MAMKTIIVLCVLVVASRAQQQRVPPGVNPNTYQQSGHPQGHPPPPQQQFQQQGQFQQGVPQQQFQQGIPQQGFQQGVPQQQFQQGMPPQQFPQQGVPQQQFQQGVPQQQFQQQQQGVPQQQFQQGMPPPPQQQQFQQPPPHQGGHQPQQRLLHKDMEHEREHMKEHMDVPIDTSKMTEQELQFHYFKMHDADGNNKLDGCELVKSLIHWHDQANHDAGSGRPVPEEKIFKDDELMNMIDPILATDDKNKDGFIDYPEFVQAQQAAQARQAQAPM